MSKRTNNAVATAPVTVKPDAKVADVRGAAERLKVLQAIDTAEDLAGSALLEGLRMTILHGATSSDEVRKGYTRCNNPDVYSSWFNRGAKAQAIVGQALALQAIDKAAGALVSGASFVRARDALKGIIDAAKQAGEKTLKPGAARMAVNASVKAATTPKAAKPATPRKATAQQTATMAAAALECGKGHKELAAFVRLASQNAQRLPEPEGRAQAHREALAALADAAEKFAVFLK